MDLEKLVALGEKMGLSGAELRKWVSQKEKEEREMKERPLKAELEKERLAAEREKEEREAKERQMKEEREAERAERERQRQREIELERLRLQQRIEAPDQARVESNPGRAQNASREWRDFLAIISSGTEFLWQKTLPGLRASIPKKPRAATCGVRTTGQ
ncbi:hypothetical protein MTO96_042511, partial [Rhipicephalus appendiculatus]